ncbi:MAG: tetratricopeptide repeat protein [Planctomycetia bacterium]|nr:tetratricopeptide repeat protein [Planctomycetia bacterium]
MLPGLLVGAVLCAGAEPEAPKSAPGMTATHKDALTKYGLAVWNLRRERLLTAAKLFEAAAKDDPEAIEPLKELVRLYAQLGREPEAIKLGRKILEKDPTDHDTAALLARLLFDAGELNEAVELAKLAADSPKLAERPDKAVRVYRELATLCEKASDFRAAEFALRKAIELVVDKRADVIAANAFTPKEADTEAAECLERLGHVLVKRGRADLAVEAFESAAKLYGDPKKVNDPLSAARLGWNLSGALEAKGDPVSALKHLEQFLKLQPRWPEPYQRLAKLLRAAGRDDDVVSTLQKYADGDQTNRALAAVLAAEMARDPATRRAADDLFTAITSVTADPKVIAVVVRSHLDTRRPIGIIAELDRCFKELKDKEKEKPDTPAQAAAKAFAAEKARAISEALEGDAEGVAAILRAAGDDLKAGTRRAYGTYYFLGVLAFKHRKLELAALQFRQAVRLAPKESQVDAYDSLIRVLWFAHKPDEVVTVCREGLQTPNLLIAPVFFNYHLALALAEQGETDAAIAAADKAIQQAGAGDRLLVRLRRHMVLRVLGKWDEAIAYGKKLADEFDSPVDRQRIRYAQAGAFWGAKKNADAEAILRAILDEDPDHAAACNDLGYHLADQGRNLDEAERLIRHAIAMDRLDRRKSGSAEPENAAYRDSLGWVLFRRGKLEEAKLELQKAATLPDGANDPVVWDHLGDVFFRLGDKEKAKTMWTTAKELYESDPRLSSRGRRDGRLEAVKRKLMLVP